MKITELFRNTSFQPTKVTDSEQAARRTEEEAAGVVEGGGEDTVSISSLSRRLNEISSILAEDEEKSKSRVAELKAQVDAGTYKVDSQEVAKSIMSFSRDLE